MNDMRPSQLIERNPVTQREHSRQKLWQITVPMILGVIIAIVLAVFASLAPAVGASQWADVSLIFLLIPVMVVSLLFLAIFAALVYAMLRILRVIPPFAYKVQSLFAQVERHVRTGSDFATEPILRIKSWLAALRALRREL